MFAETTGSRKAIGDVDVIYHDGLYHLFHLVLPNHDFIAHAVSENAFNWRRVDNALFIGHPGSWDDLMLWTMHVSRDPNRAGHWRMFYTGLSRRDQGLKQRIGLAVSDDLYHWKKTAVNWSDLRGKHDPESIQQVRRKLANSETSCLQSPSDDSSCFPLEPDGRFYESDIDEGRHWVSFRDPYFYQQDGKGWLLAAGRIKEGPVVRRGCVALLEETGEHCFEARPPLHHPGLYDDIEVPNLMRVEGEYYLIGSIREDAKIRYWHTDSLEKPWRSYYDNVLLAQGNYAGRICHDPHGTLLWNFFSYTPHDRVSNNLMPPPKRLVREANGQLKTASFEGFDRELGTRAKTDTIKRLKQPNLPEDCEVSGELLRLSSDAGFQSFVFGDQVSSFRFRTKMRLAGLGKCGLVFRIHPQTQDGYYLSLDLMKGVAQLRAWGTGPDGGGESMMSFKSLQAGYWYSRTPGEAELQLIAFGSYVELSINGRVILSLADQTFQQGLMGVYIESAHVELSRTELNHLRAPQQSDEHLAQG